MSYFKAHHMWFQLGGLCARPYWRTLQHSSDLGGFQAAAASKKREEKGRKEQEEGVHCAGENSPLLREYGCYRDRLIIRLGPNSG